LYLEYVIFYFSLLKNMFDVASEQESKSYIYCNRNKRGENKMTECKTCKEVNQIQAIRKSDGQTIFLINVPEKPHCSCKAADIKKV